MKGRRNNLQGVTRDYLTFIGSKLGANLLDLIGPYALIRFYNNFTLIITEYYL